MGTDSAGRKPPIDLTEEQQALYDAIVSGPRSMSPFPPIDANGQLRQPFNLMLPAPRLGLIAQSMGAELRFGGVLPDRLRELAICLVAVHVGSLHEWRVHSSLAIEFGASTQQLAALRNQSSIPDLDQRETCGLKLCTALLRREEIHDSLREEAKREFGLEGVVEMAFLVGYYGLLANLLSLGKI